MKQSWGLPGFHEVRYIPHVLELFRSLKEIGSWKELCNSQHAAFRSIGPYLKSLGQYRFLGVSLDHSPVRYVTETISGIPTIRKHSEPTVRAIIKFVHLYADYILEFVPKILQDCTHPWSSLASRTIEPISLLECITGTKAEENEEIEYDDNALRMVVDSAMPWKDLVNFVLKEDPRLSDVLYMEYHGGALLRHIRKQISNCLYSMKSYMNDLFVNRWFLEVKGGSGVLNQDKYVKLKLKKTDTVIRFTKMDLQHYDMKTHFELTVTRKSSNLCFHVVPDVKTIVEDMFNPEIHVDVLGPRHFLIIFMLVNARVMNFETGLESFFSSLESQNFSGGQHWQTLEHRGAIKLHVNDNFSQLQENMQQLAKLSLQGMPK